MDWKKDLKKRYARSGWDAFRAADEAFKLRLEQFCAERSISIVDDNPEGHDWMVLLKSGEELFVDRRSYDMGGGKMFWIEYKPEGGGITAEFFNADGLSEKPEILIPNSEVSMSCDEWQ